MTNQTLKFAISLTDQRDADSLDINLANIFANLIPNANLLLYKRVRMKQAGQSPVFQIFTTKKNKQGQSDLFWQRDIDLKSLSDSIIESVETSQPREFIDEKDNYHLIIPIINDFNIVTIVHISDSGSFEKVKTDIFALLKIYQNNLQILTESEKDTLTGLFNRRTFDRKLKKLLNNQILKQNFYSTIQKRSRIDNSTAWLVIIDIDHFKKVNDTYGHVHGDEVLLRLSQIMQSSFRGTDLLFRFGGEEFVIILEPVSDKTAINLLERFRETVWAYDFPLVGHVSISLGYTKISEKNFPPIVLSKADKALYYTKEHGRNATNLYESLIEKKLVSAPSTADEGEIDLFLSSRG